MTDLLEISVTIPGVPVPKARARVTRRGTYTPAKTKAWCEAAALYMKAAVKRANRPAWVAQWFEPKAPVLLQVIAVFPCPKHDYRKRRPVGRRKHTVKPDGDNVLKNVMDAGEGILWYGDAQISTASVSKWIAAQDEDPYVQIVAMIDEVRL